MKKKSYSGSYFTFSSSSRIIVPNKSTCLLTSLFLTSFLLKNILGWTYLKFFLGKQRSIQSPNPAIRSKTFSDISIHCNLKNSLLNHISSNSFYMSKIMINFPGKLCKILWKALLWLVVSSGFAWKFDGQTPGKYRSCKSFFSRNSYILLKILLSTGTSDTIRLVASYYMSRNNIELFPCTLEHSRSSANGKWFCYS